ncbi:MAG: ParA family protein [Desulfarculus sp.]|nr:ParA family protein [Pseudomonadota bacterium]MBV1714918.1 ParA family protein [Desulfarculus sp.]MBU4573058.1 ParA family protein [Pseudomonadota bacterium]MBU4599029.1 ParA family protein [Pseudomonadota bacterium]MBV1737418.1 ParA family protein [Desulfarculus sp.]
MSNNTTNGDVKKTQRIAVISGKGGTGKSLVTASIGFVLAHCGYKVLLVDMDLFTGGLTFFLSGLSEKPDRISRGLLDVFADKYEDKNKDNQNNCKIDKIKISHQFVDGNLFLLPSLSSRRRNVSELTISKDVSTLPQIMNILFRDVIGMEESFDYIIFDTRGGSDITSVGSALTCDKLVVVTEADKVSWDTGRILLDAIEDAWNAYCYDDPFPGVGFILNKNVLPPEGVETYLKKIWSAKHITTIPLDRDAIAYFQEDKMPIVEDISCEFSEAIVTGIGDFFDVMVGNSKISERYINLRIKAREKK